jgi:hypothetical protein
MNRARVDPIANAVLYEGYILYPYRASTKNRQRWTFGGLFPESSQRVRDGRESCTQQTECLIEGTRATTFEALVRFLQLTDRRVGAIDPPMTEWTDDADPPYREVESLRVGDAPYHAWQEAVEREVALAGTSLDELCQAPVRHLFRFEGGRWLEPLREFGGPVAGVLVREQADLAGLVEISAREVEPGLFRVSIQITNRTPTEEAADVERDRDHAALRAFASTHAILAVERGAFVSLMDPPEPWCAAASACRNVGAWPVLVGDERRRDMMLSAPIILYDFPQVAPESPGDFFDGTEIDEMLTLRILTLTDEEKGAMSSVDERAGALLARTEALAREHLLGLHGTIRDLRPAPTGDQPC